MLEWVAISSSRGSSLSRDRTHDSCLADGFLTTEPLGYNKVRKELGEGEVILIDMIATNLLEFIRNIHVYLK